MTDSERDTLYAQLSSNIRDARKAKGWSQTKLSKHSAVSVTRGSIVNIEAGRQRPPLHVIWELAEALGKEPTDLIPAKADLRPPLALLNEELARKIKKVTKGNDRAFLQVSRFVKTVTTPPTEE